MNLVLFFLFVLSRVVTTSHVCLFEFKLKIQFLSHISMSISMQLLVTFLFPVLHSHCCIVVSGCCIGHQIEPFHHHSSPFIKPCWDSVVLEGCMYRRDPRFCFKTRMIPCIIFYYSIGKYSIYILIPLPSYIIWTLIILQVLSIANGELV